MKYSIIIPVYNAENTLDRCLSSIINQKFDDYEIILVNDGSKDGSLNVCNGFAEKYKNIKVFDKSNGGAASARNVGLDHASGDFILFVDSDDYVEKNYFSELEKYNASRGLVVFTNSWFSKAEIYKREINDSINDSDMFEKTKYLLDSRTINGPTCKVFDRALIESHGIRFDIRMPVAEDFIFGLKYLIYCENITIKNISVYMNDRSSSDSLSRGKKSGLMDVCQIVFDEAYKILDSSGFTQMQKNQLFRIWDKLHVESFGSCVMEEFKDASKTNSEIKKEIKKMCVKFYSRYKGGYGYCNIVHFIMRLCIKYKLKNTLFYFGKLYVAKRKRT